MRHLLSRRMLALLVAVSCSAAAHAADAPPPNAESEPELLIPRTARHGLWGGPVVQLSTVRGRGAVLVGGRGGWLFDGRLTLGGGGFGLTNRIPAPPEVAAPGERLDLQMGYGGGWVEYTLSPLRLVHLSVGALIGGGGISLAWHDGGSYGSRSDAFFLAEPAVTAELNLARSVRVDVGAAYRFVAGADMAGLSYSDIAGFSLVAALKFGKF